MEIKSFMLKLPIELHGQLKAKCSLNNETMTSVFKKMAHHYVENDEIGLTKEAVDKIIYLPTAKRRVRVITLSNEIESLPIELVAKLKFAKIYGHDERYFMSTGTNINEIAKKDYKSLKLHGLTYYKFIEKRILESLERGVSND